MTTPELLVTVFPELHTAGHQGLNTETPGHRAHDGCCSVCSVLQTGVPVDVPQIAAIDIDRVAEQVAWFDFAFRLTNARAGSHAQARAPPSIS